MGKNACRPVVLSNEEAARLNRLANIRPAQQKSSTPPEADKWEMTSRSEIVEGVSKEKNAKQFKTPEAGSRNSSTSNMEIEVVEVSSVAGTPANKGAAKGRGTVRNGASTVDTKEEGASKPRIERTI